MPVAGRIAAFSSVLGGVPGAQLVPRLRGTRGWNDPARRYFMARTREYGGTRTAGMIFGNGCRSHERNWLDA